MFTWSKWAIFAALGVACVAQEAGVDLRGGLKINLPKDSPLAGASLGTMADLPDLAGLRAASRMSRRRPPLR